MEDNVLETARQACADGRFAEAIVDLEQALADGPADRRCLELLADAYVASKQRRKAFETWNRLIGLGEVSARTWCRIGETLAAAGEYAQSIGFFRNSLSLADSDEAHHHLGQSLFRMGQIDEAAEHLELAARRSDAMPSRIGLATMIPGAPSHDQQALLDVRQEFADWLGRSALASEAPAAPKRARDPDAPIRIGYVSSWFTGANYMKPVWALINNHDRMRWEVHLFTDSPPDADMTGYQPQSSDRIHPTGALDNTGLARAIAAQGIDVLIDLNAYSTPMRLGTFVTSPAPVTAAWFNMYATSGLPGFHYIIGDEEVAKPEDDPFYTERILRLPTSYLTFNTAHRTPPVVDPPCIAKGHITFGSLIAQYKMTQSVIDSWSEILTAVPAARLYLANATMDREQNRVWLAERFEEAGIASERIDIAGGAPHYDYLQNYDRMDFALDAFPYNGGTTTMEAIWQGVPVLTFDGDRWASRTSQTILRRSEFGEFVADCRAGMIDLAIGLARDPDTPERLQSLRHGAREGLLAAPICDAPAMARAMEALLEDALEAA